jgi:hypothetical protein
MEYCEELWFLPPATNAGGGVGAYRDLAGSTSCFAYTRPLVSIP